MTKRQSTQSTLMVIYIGHFKVSTFFTIVQIILMIYSGRCILKCQHLCLWV